MVRFLLGLTLLSITACSDKSRECAPVFFGGEIVNPKSDYVALFHNDTYVDSVRLDAQNRFSFKLEGLEEGLYYFSHSPEHQYIYLKGGDSLLARLNTLEFDESLVYAGKGSALNNFMTEMYLALEREEPLIATYFPLDPEEFAQKIDSLRGAKVSYMKEIELDKQLSDREMAMARASIDYGTYIHMEEYPFTHRRKTGEKAIHELETPFYAYRKNIDLGNRDLFYYRPYFDFMKMHFGNLSYVHCLQGCDRDTIVHKRLHFNRHKIAMVDSLVVAKDLRDFLFRSFTLDYLLKEHSPGPESDAFVDNFRALSSNEGQKAEISQLYTAISNLQPGSKLPDLLLRDTGNKEVHLRDLVEGEGHTVIYFWTASQKMHFNNVGKQIEKLKEKYPDHRFVGINLRTSFPQWTLLLEEYGMDGESQFFGENFKEIQTTMVLDGLNKCVLTKDGLVVDGFANIFNL